MNILISSAGRRGALVRLAAAEAAAVGGEVFGADASASSAACRMTAAWARMPRCSDPAFVDSLLTLCRRWRIGLVIPTIDTELPVLAAVRDRFADMGTRIALSGPATVEIGGDKLLTHGFLERTGLPTVRRFPPLIGADGRPAPPVPRPEDYPVILKPRRGSASHGVQLIDDEDALQFFHRRTAEPIVQEFAAGTEYTVNMFVDRRGRCVAAVPHRRIETRGGEVSKCVTERHEGLTRCAARMAAALPDAYGPMCFQAFVDGEAVRIIEINCRFGGGYPVAYAAGANFLGWLLDDCLGRPLRQPQDDWRAGVAMLRWDDAVFTSQADLAA